MTPNNHVTVTLTPELRLNQALIDAGIEDAASVTKLTITITEAFRREEQDWEELWLAK